MAQKITALVLTAAVSFVYTHPTTHSPPFWYSFAGSGIPLYLVSIKTSIPNIT
ncbi:hypothetical protein P692DRAFT_20839960 [Suillus brevipes Sb2]|nr:hypothetical protein P692DRAFT_20839960 [Suillus brevipes Sb2]